MKNSLVNTWIWRYLLGFAQALPSSLDWKTIRRQYHRFQYDAVAGINQ